MGKYSEFEIRTQPWFDQSNFKGFNQAIPMKTLVIHCFDPRAADIPQAVAEHFGDEVYPGEIILDEAGNRVGSTRTLSEQDLLRINRRRRDSNRFWICCATLLATVSRVAAQQARLRSGPAMRYGTIGNPGGGSK